MNCYLVDATYYQQCVSTSGCPECTGLGFIPVGNVNLSEMKLGLSYRIRIYGSEIVSCVLRNLQMDLAANTFILTALALLPKNPQPILFVSEGDHRGEDCSDIR